MTTDSSSAGASGPRIVAKPAPEYDTCAPDLLPVDQVAFVEGIDNHFLQAFSKAMSDYLDAPCSAASGGIDQVPASTFLDAGRSDACLITLDLSPVRGQAWIGLGKGMVSRVLDVLLGAKLGSTPADRSGITDIERHVLRELFDILVNALNASWSKTGLAFAISPGNPSADLSAAADGTTLVLKCLVRIGEAEESFRIAIPVLLVRLAVLQSEQTEGVASFATGARADLLEALSSASLQLEAVLSGSTLRMSDLAAMQKGQILVLAQPAGSALDCLVNGKPKFRGEWITQGDRPALQIDSVIETAASRRVQPV